MNWANHPIWDTIIIFWVISAAVNALPEPSETSSGWYRWVYTFLTTLVGHLHDAINQRKQPRPSASS
jgi:hypothetical protein